MFPAPQHDGAPPSSGANLPAAATEVPCERAAPGTAVDPGGENPPPTLPIAAVGTSVPDGAARCDEATCPPTSPPGPPPGALPRPFGNYELLEEIARGGMGVVYKAREINPPRIVALKMILAGALATPEAVARFRIEARAAAKLDHPGIVPIFEIGEGEGQAFFTMPFVAGGSLKDLLNDGPVNPWTAARLVQQVAQAVQYAHDRGVIHRDVKPQNILLQPQESSLSADAGGADNRLVCRLTDFGLARMVEEGGMTATGEAMGTPGYMPPEQAAGRVHQIDARSDVYSTGAVLYCLLTGRPPFQAASIAETLLQVLEEEPVPPRRLNPGIPRDLETICLKCLQKKPARRYASAAALAEDLGLFLHGEPILARPVSLLERAVRWTRRHPTAAALAGAGLAALVGLLLLGVLFTRRVQGERDLAVEATHRAESERARAARARDLAVEAERRSETLRYSMAMGLAQRELEAGNLSRANEVLQQSSPERRGWEHRFLTALYGRKRQELQNQTRPIRSIVFSPDGRRLASGSASGTVKLWDLATGNARHFQGHIDPVTAVCASPDGKYLASSSRDQTVRLWDAESGRELRVFRGHGDIVWDVCFSPDGKSLVSASEDFTVKVWNVQTGEAEHTLRGHTLTVRSVCFSPDGKLLASASEDQTVKVWNTQTYEEQDTIEKHASKAIRVCWSPDGKWLASLSQGGTVHLWNARERKSFSHPGAPIQSKCAQICFSPDGKRLGLACDNGTVQLWEFQTDHEPRILEGRSRKVLTVSFSLDGERLAAGAENGVVTVWDAHTLKELLTLKEDAPKVNCACVSPNGEWIASTHASLTSIIRLWKSRVGQEVLPLEGHHGKVWSVCFSPDNTLLASASDDRTVKIWNVETGKEVRTLTGHTGAVRGLCFSPDGKALASGSEDRTVKVWNVQTGKVEHTFSGHDEAVFCVGFGPDGRVASGSADRTVKVWNRQTEKVEYTLTGHAGSVLSLCFSRDGKLASGGEGGALILWNVQTGAREHAFQGRLGAVWSVLVNGEGKRLTTAGAGGMIGTCDLTKHPLTLSLAHHRDLPDVWDVGADKNGRPVVLGKGADGLMRVWSVETDKVRMLQNFRREIRSLCYSPDLGGKYLASASDSRDGPRVILWDKEARQVRRSFPVPNKGKIWSLAFRRDGKRLAAAGADGVVRVWNVETGEEVRALKGHKAAVRSVCFHPDGKLLASASDDRTVKIWNVETGKEERTLLGHAGRVHCVCFHPDGKTLASASEDQTVKVWSVETGEEEYTLKGHAGRVHCVCFRPDGVVVASGSEDQTVRLWDARTGAPLRTLKGQTMVFSIGFSPDGRRLASGHRNGSVEVWDAAAGQETLTLKDHRSEVWSVCFSPDGRRLASASQEFKVWDAEQ